MASDRTPVPAPSPATEWFKRLGFSGKLLAIGGAAGVLVGFLPALTVHLSKTETESAIVLDSWRGQLGSVAYIVAVVLSILLYPHNRSPHKNLCWVGIGVSSVALLLAVWLLFNAWRASAAWRSLEHPANVGVGGVSNVLIAAAVLAGAVLKAREEKLL